MPGVVFDVKAKPGDQVEVGKAIVVLSAMKMETVVSATVAGRIAELPVKPGDDVAAGDLLFKIE
jgi:pyruvate carboxylase